MSHEVFISYRRDDSLWFTGRLYDRLQAAFSRQSVFKDVDSIPPGKDFLNYISERLRGCLVCLVIIDNAWTTIENDCGRRLFQADDHVRIEIATALANETTTTIPILVGNTPMPRAEDLPDDLKLLARRNAIRIEPDPDFHRDVDRLVEWLNRYLQDPATVQQLFSRAIESFKNGAARHAFEDLNRAIEMEANHADAFFLRGIINANGGNFAAAVKDFERTLELDPNHKQARTEIARTKREISGGKLKP